ncbi:MAG: glycosyltransferase [Planctomycetota bacterium]
MILFVLPAYNEGEGIARLLGLLADRMKDQRLDYRVLLVDDGSSDDTLAEARAFLERMPLTIIHHERNRGLGVAIWTGLSSAVAEASDDDVIITMDADCSHDPILAGPLADAVRTGSCEVAIASRFVEGGAEVGVPFHRKILSRGAGLIFRTLFPTSHVRDYSCGYRAYRASTLRRGLEAYGRGFIVESGFGCMVEILVKLRALGAKFGEVPLVLRYDQKLGASKMRIVRTVVRYGMFILRAMTLPKLPERQSVIRLTADAPEPDALAVPGPEDTMVESSLSRESSHT